MGIHHETHERHEKNLHRIGEEHGFFRYTRNKNSCLPAIPVVPNPMPKNTKSPKSPDELLRDALIPPDEHPYPLPEKWEWVKLGSISLKITKGSTPTSYGYKFQSEGIAFIKIENVKEGRIISESIKFFISEDANSSQKRSQLEVNDLLFSIAGTIGETCIVTEKDLPANTNQALAIIRGYDKFALPRFLGLQLSSFIADRVKSKARGGAMNNISLGDLKQLKLPLPPLAEQRRIVGRLESLLGKIRAARSLIQEARDSFATRRAAILHKAFSGELTQKWRDEHPEVNPISETIEESEEKPYPLPQKWKWVKFSNIGDLQRGKSKHRPRNDERLFGGEYPFIQTGDVARADGKIIGHNQTLSEFGLQQSRLFPKNTVCITIAANIADSAILTYDCCFPDSVVGFIANKSACNSSYVNYYIETIKNDLEQYAPATAQKNINLKILRDVAVPLQSLEEQQEIVRILESLLDHEAEAKALSELEEELELLEKSILSKAFRGELNTGDPQDEPALELLTRSLAEKNM